MSLRRYDKKGSADEGIPSDRDLVRSPCHLNELRTALKMKRRDEDIVGRAKGRLEEEQEGKPLDAEATRQPEYGREVEKDARKRKDGLPSDRRRAGE